jgi:hypothetical protein
MDRQGAIEEAEDFLARVKLHREVWLDEPVRSVPELVCINRGDEDEAWVNGQRDTEFGYANGVGGWALRVRYVEQRVYPGGGREQLGLVDEDKLLAASLDDQIAALEALPLLLAEVKKAGQQAITISEKVQTLLKTFSQGQTTESESEAGLQR